jgi:hypothetical protein
MSSSISEEANLVKYMRRELKHGYDSSWESSKDTVSLLPSAGRPPASFSFGMKQHYQTGIAYRQATKLISVHSQTMSSTTTPPRKMCTRSLRSPSSNPPWMASTAPFLHTAKRHQVAFRASTAIETLSCQPQRFRLKRHTSMGMHTLNPSLHSVMLPSSGKTHTMRGDSNEAGIIPLAVRSIFNTIEQVCRPNGPRVRT